jgi:hypothetical protein
MPPNGKVLLAETLVPPGDRVLIRVLGSDGSGEAVAEIRRPREL